MTAQSINPFVNNNSADRVQGWAYVRRPTQPVTPTVERGGRTIASSVADQHRAVLRDGNCAFDFTLTREQAQAVIAAEGDLAAPAHSGDTNVSVPIRQACLADISGLREQW